jgi:hypothetical protein
MTVLSACQSAATKLNQPRPATVYGSTTPFAQELGDLANETATAIAKAHEWQVLTKLATLTGDASTTAFALPSDYDRLPLKASLLTSQFSSPLTQARDLDEWLDLQIRPFIGAPGYWMILGGQVQVVPAIETGVTAQFYYIGNQIASGSKTTFTTDADTFLLPERLLTLGIVWRWKAQKGLEYAEHLKNYEIAFGEEAGRDRGMRMLSMGRRRISYGAELSYPGTIIP